MTDTWIVISNDSECLTHESVRDRIELFVVLRYSKTCPSSSVNDARYNFFFTGSHIRKFLTNTSCDLRAR